MGLAGTPSGTYFGMVKHNVTTLVNALKWPKACYLKPLLLKNLVN
jgi:hypothetical protein